MVDDRLVVFLSNLCVVLILVVIRVVLVWYDADDVSSARGDDPRGVDALAEVPLHDTPPSIDRSAVWSEDEVYGYARVA